MAVGDATATEVAEVLDILWGGSETLIVVSSDLSHYLSYTLAESVDMQTVQSILSMDSTLTHQQACGGTPINGLILSALKHHYNLNCWIYVTLATLLATKVVWWVMQR